MSIINVIYNNVRAVQDRVYKTLGREYLPNVIMLGHKEWRELRSAEWNSLLNVYDYENPLFMGIPIEIVNKESYMSIDYRWPVFTGGDQPGGVTDND